MVRAAASPANVGPAGQLYRDFTGLVLHCGHCGALYVDCVAGGSSCTPPSARPIPRSSGSTFVVDPAPPLRSGETKCPDHRRADCRYAQGGDAAGRPQVLGVSSPSAKLVAYCPCTEFDRSGCRDCFRS